MIDTLHIDDLDGAVTLAVAIHVFKSTDEGTETIAVFDEEHREVIQDLLAEVERLRGKNQALLKDVMFLVDLEDFSASERYLIYSRQHRQELLRENERLSEIEQEWLVMWATLEELNLVADVRKNMTLHGFVFPTDEDMEGEEE